MEKLSFTLYEVFGYFLPGTIGILSLAILFWTFFLPATPVPVQSVELSKLWYFALTVLAYYAGHVVQSISRSLFTNPDESVLQRQDVGMAPLVSSAQSELAARLGMSGDTKPTDSATVRLCDELAVQYGQLGDRDVFVYREGFYRGSFAAFALLDFALLCRLIIPGSQLIFADAHRFDISRLQWAFLIVVVSCSIVFLLKRYKHFAALRVMRGLLAFVSRSRFQDVGKTAAEAKPVRTV